MRGPLKITKSNGNILQSIDNENAFSVYNDILEEVENIRLSREGFFAFAKDHPFGIVLKGTAEVVVRDPIAVNEDNEIICVADIPQDAELYVLHGNVSSLLASSEQIAAECSKFSASAYTPYLFDCISRAMFLEDKFDLELYNIQRLIKYPVEGALSIGEIASQENGSLAIHNKSTVLGLLPKRQ